MDWKLEVVVVPVSDVDRAKHFYSKQVGFHVDIDHRVNDDIRIVQLTPPGSACSITIGTGIGAAQAGTFQGLQLVVDDLDRARSELLLRGVAVSAIQHMEDGQWLNGRGGAWNNFVFFSDPDGNSWAVQERHYG